MSKSSGISQSRQFAYGNPLMMRHQVNVELVGYPKNTINKGHTQVNQVVIRRPFE